MRTQPICDMIFLQSLCSYCALYFGLITLNDMHCVSALCDIGCKGHVGEIRGHIFLCVSNNNFYATDQQDLINM